MLLPQMLGGEGWPRAAPSTRLGAALVNHFVLRAMVDRLRWLELLARPTPNV
jgi:hypothetical protein